MTIYETLKRFALRRLPPSWLALLKMRHYRRVLRTFDEREEPDMAVVRALLRPGMAAIDVGANIGTYTKLLAELVGDSGAVVSIEPVPETFAILAGNVRALRLGNVQLMQAAASSGEGQATMSIPAYAHGGENFYEAAIVGERRSSSRTGHDVLVPTMPLDAIAVRRTHVHFIKCDVEGHEAACIAGAASLISRDAPAWLIEISEDPDVGGSKSAALFATLAAAGCIPWLFDGQVLRRRRRGDQSINYFFLADEHVQRIRQRAPDLVRDG
jgi:FkbM family methyltransferase